jgi:hypothetical protein
MPFLLPWNGWKRVIPCFAMFNQHDQLALSNRDYPRMEKLPVENFADLKFITDAPTAPAQHFLHPKPIQMEA